MNLIEQLGGSPMARKHKVYQGFYKLLGKFEREIPDDTFVHASVKERYDKDSKYRPKPLVKVVQNAWSNLVG